jgi:hypothetical protein
MSAENAEPAKALDTIIATEANSKIPFLLSLP